MTDYAAEHKVPPYDVRRRVNTDPDFYPLVGAFLAKRDVTKDLGAPVWDDPGKVWYIAIADQDAIGMVAYWGKTVCSFWVAPRVRGFSVGYVLLRHLMADVPIDQTVTTIATKDSEMLFEAVGFTRGRPRGKYHVYARPGASVPAEGDSRV